MIMDMCLFVLLLAIVQYVIGLVYFSYDMCLCGCYVIMDIFFSLLMSYTIATKFLPLQLYCIL